MHIACSIKSEHQQLRSVKLKFHANNSDKTLIRNCKSQTYCYVSQSQIGDLVTS